MGLAELLVIAPLLVLLVGGPIAFALAMRKRQREAARVGTCGACGAPLPRQAAACPACGAELRRRGA